MANAKCNQLLVQPLVKRDGALERGRIGLDAARRCAALKTEVSG